VSKGAASACLVGLDVGSTSIKAVLVVPGGGVVHVARRATPTHAVPDGPVGSGAAGGAAAGAVHRPAELLAAAEPVIAECVAAASSLGLPPPAAIGIASMAEAGVPLDAGGEPMGDIVAWYDTRPAPQAAWLETRIGAAALFARTGLRPEPKYTLPKLLWLRAERPDEIGRMRHWAGVAELVAHSLSGELATNASLACRTAAFDVGERRWDAELLGLAGIGAEQMPRVLPLGAVAGGLTVAAAARLGLAAGTPVAIAGHDHLVGALGAGVSRPGDVLDSMGSAEVALLVTPRPVLTEELRLAGFSSGCHAIDGLGYVAGGLQASGALVEWFIDRYLAEAGPSAAAAASATDSDILAAAAPSARYAALMGLLDRAGDGPASSIVLPYLRGRTAPQRDPAATLQLDGSPPPAPGADPASPEFAAALVDAAAFHVRWMLDELGRLTGAAPERIRVIGGGTRNRRWLAAKAALGPGRLEIALTDEAAAHGAALVAGVAGGVYGSVASAIEDAARTEPVSAAAAVRARYDEAFRDRWLPAVRATFR
jgi:xylulokinase